MIHGFLNIHKERGLTSHQVVAQIRRILNQAEVGHTGTLDPEATGVLVIGLGQATRSFPFLNEHIKVYRAELILGQVTDTQDATGCVLSDKPDTCVEWEDIQRSAADLTGDIRQIPPMFSAVKLNGHKLYELARQGLVIERESRPITVYQWRFLNPQPRYFYRESVCCEITCSKGTYIRTLINDLGGALGCGAHMGGLVRLQSGDFNLADAHTVAEVKEAFSQGRLAEMLISLNLALSHLEPLWVAVEDLVKIKNGGKLSYTKYSTAGEMARVLDSASQLVAIVQKKETETYPYWQPIKVFSV